MVLDQQREFLLVELLEPLLPLNLFERLLAGVAREVETDHANVFAAAGSAYGRRLGIPFFRPLANLVVIGQGAG
ncbi:MAG: hypothetical protein H0X25_18200 [Acidobacteriales bacterium]|nr:hypothetical protein [Terriglobales bacterium]